MNARKTIAWTIVWSAFSAVTGMALGILAVGSPPATPNQTPAAVVHPIAQPTQNVDEPVDPTTEVAIPETVHTTADDAPTNVEAPPVTTTAKPAPTTTTVKPAPVDTPAETIHTTTEDTPTP